MAQRFRKLPLKQNASLDDVKRELDRIAAWARRNACGPITPRLEWAIAVLDLHQNEKD